MSNSNEHTIEIEIELALANADETTIDLTGCSALGIPPELRALLSRCNCPDCIAARIAAAEYFREFGTECE